MQLDILGQLRLDASETEARHPVGAMVARTMPAGGVAIELGPADGAPLLRLSLSRPEAQRLSASLSKVLSGAGEAVILTDD